MKTIQPADAIPVIGSIIAPFPFGVGYGAWKLGNYIYEKFNKPATPIHPRKKTEIEELTAEPIYFVVAILAKFAKADGIVTKNEIATIEDILRDIELTGKSRAKAISIFRKHKSGALSYEESLRIFAGLTEDSKDFRSALCILLLRLAHADGTPPQRAIEGVRQACNACEVDYAEVYQIFQQQEQGRREAIDALSSEKPAPSVQSILKELDALTGLTAVKQGVQSLFNYLRVQRLRLEQGLPTKQITTHLVFTGNPGTGKTTVARLLAKLYQAMDFLPGGQLIETDRSGLVGEYLGQTAIKTSEVVKKALGGVLFIDEAYALARKVDGRQGDMFGTEAIDTFLKAMEDNRDKLIVIVAGYRQPMQEFLESNPGLRSRFTRYIDFPDYSPAELSEIFEKMVAKEGYQLSEAASRRASAVFTEAFASRTTTFGNGRLVRTVFEQACVRLADRLATDDDITRAELMMLQPEDIDPASPERDHVVGVRGSR